MTDKQIERKLARLIVKIEKYPHQLSTKDRDYLAKVLAIKSYVDKKQKEKEA